MEKCLQGYPLQEQSPRYDATFHGAVLSILDILFLFDLDTAVLCELIHRYISKHRDSRGRRSIHLGEVDTYLLAEDLMLVCSLVRSEEQLANCSLTDLARDDRVSLEMDLALHQL